MTEKKKSNITLIGMPSSGKSTIGVLLAKRLGYSFVDVDIVIQEKEGRLLKEIIAEQGMDGFMEVENRINAELDVTHSVIAPGGSVIFGKEAMEHLRQIQRNQPDCLFKAGFRGSRTADWQCGRQGRGAERRPDLKRFI